MRHPACGTRRFLGKLAAALAPPEPQLQHTALRLTARGWETLPLPAREHSGALVVVLDMHTPRWLPSTVTDGPGTFAVPDRPVGRSPARCWPQFASSSARWKSIRRRRNAMDDAARRGQRPRDVRHAQVVTYVACATRAAQVLGGSSRPLPRALDAGQRLVGVVRSRGGSLFRSSPSRPSVGRTSSRAMRRMPSRSRSAGGREVPSYPRAAFYAYAHPPAGGFCPQRFRHRRPPMGTHSR